MNIVQYQTLEDYIRDKYNNNPTWFTEEIETSQNMNRVSNVLGYKDYLDGEHKIKSKEDSTWKGEKFVTTKLILNEAKTILNFHDTYLLGKRVTLTGSDKIVKAYNDVYKKGKFHITDSNIIKKVNRYGDSFEYIYKDEKSKVPTSKLIPSESAFPIFSEDTNEYIGLIEYYLIDSNKVEYYYIYFPNKVEYWNNEGGDLQLIHTFANPHGKLPIPYHNYNDKDDRFGRSELEDIMPILDVLESLISKMSDAVHTYTLNPIPVSVGQKVEGTIPADAVGYMINLDTGEFNFKNATMDYSTIKLLLDTLHKKLETIGAIPSVAMGNTNIANVSEVSLNMLYSLAEIKATLNEQWLREGFEQRWEAIRILLEMDGITFNNDEYIDCEFNYSKPVNKQELLDNLKTQFDMGAISIQSIIEKSPLTSNRQQEQERLQKEEDKVNNSKNSHNTNIQNNMNNVNENSNKTQ